MDNFKGHRINYQPTNMRLEQFKPNMTSFVQPYDAGIIRTFKAHYCCAFCICAIDLDEAGEKDIYEIDLLKVMLMANDAWKAMTPETIRNCWRHSGILGCM
jgi:hypothetical protein